jgi:hypothetical protein
MWKVVVLSTYPALFAIALGISSQMNHYNIRMLHLPDAA